MLHVVIPLLVVVASVQGFRVPPPVQHHRIIVDHRPPQQWAAPRGSRVQLDEGDRNYISHEVSDPDVGPKGITALKDSELGACFLYQYMKPLVIPRVQRNFYTRTKTATILLSPKDKLRFRQSVGPAVDSLCNMVRSYWLDDYMFYMYMTNKLHPKNAAPPPLPSDEEDEELAADMVFPTPPPLQEVHVVRTPPPLPHLDHEVKAPPAFDHHEVKAPPALDHHEVKAPPALDHHEAKAPPGLVHHDVKAPPPVTVHRIRIPPPPPSNE